MVIPSITIGERQIGEGAPCFLIAEAGVNHNGDPEQARRLVDAAADAGSDAVKFQTFRSEHLASPQAPKADYQHRSTDAGESQLDMLRRLELPRSAYPVLQARCAERGILFLSSAFDEADADFLAQLGAPAIKIPSGELTNLPFLAHAARRGLPLIVSTGMAALREVEEAVAAIREAGGRGLVLLHCVSRYPAPAAHANLRAMRTLADAFGVPVGFSDHTPGIAVAVAAAALGAHVIEKHLTLDRSLPGPDHSSSLDPREFRALVEHCRCGQPLVKLTRIPALQLLTGILLDDFVGIVLEYVTGEDPAYEVHTLDE